MPWVVDIEKLSGECRGHYQAQLRRIPDLLSENQGRGRSPRYVLEQGIKGVIYGSKLKLDGAGGGGICDEQCRGFQDKLKFGDKSSMKRKFRTLDEWKNERWPYM